MVNKQFWADPYLTVLDTRVAQVQGKEITLEETIFYALSGGQESDTGTIGGYSVRAARKEGREIYYDVGDGHALRAGDPVTVTIDWERRYRLMRLHFAAEIVLEWTYRYLRGISKIGAHIAQEKARIDFHWEENIAPWLPGIQQEANRIVALDAPIISAFSDEGLERRYWEVAGFARVPCGGTHVRRTGEVGEIRLKRNNIGKGKERIEIYLDN